VSRTPTDGTLPIPVALKLNAGFLSFTVVSITPEFLTLVNSR
jgi:hypothetical protein